MYTKISMNQAPSLEPYALPSEAPKAIEIEPVKVPSPPPMPAVAARVWDQPKPALFPAPAITEAPEPILIPSPEPEKELPPPMLEICPEKPISTVVEKRAETISFPPELPVEQKKFPSSIPFTTAMSESVVKQSIKKFSQPDIKEESKVGEKTVSAASKTSSQQSVMLNGFATDSKTSTETFSSMKQSSFFSESQSVVTSGTISTAKPSQVPVPTKFVPKPLAPSVQKEKEKPSQSLVPVWKPKKDAEPKPSWRKVPMPQQTTSTVIQKSVESKSSSTDVPQPPPIFTQSIAETVVSSSGIPQVSESKYSASETKSTSTGSSQTSSMPSSSYSTESSTTTRTSYSTEEISITKKYEMVLEHKTETISTGSGTKPLSPKPIIKKQQKEGPKPKKEVVIEEEPVVGAEVKPPQFSKVRGAESLRKIYSHF